MAEGAIFKIVTVVYNAEWLAHNPDIPNAERIHVNVDMLRRVFEGSFVAFDDAEEGVPIIVVEDASRTSSYNILIDGEQPSDETSDQEIEFNTEKAIESFFQLGSFWNAYRDRQQRNRRGVIPRYFSPSCGTNPSPHPSHPQRRP